MLKKLITLKNLIPNDIKTVIWTLGYTVLAFTADTSIDLIADLKLPVYVIAGIGILLAAISKYARKRLIISKLNEV